MDDLVKRLRSHLGGVSTDAMRGDNLAITLASAFEDPDEEPDGDTGWGATALREGDAALDAIHAHYKPLADRIEALEAEVAQLRAAMEWQLVDTCPHNAIVLLAWHDRYSGVWRYEVGSASTGSRYENGYSTVSYHGSATHWMPLPAEPEGEV
jgi:hypothetical protein